MDVSRLDAGGPVLGVLPEALYYQTKLEVSPDYVLVMYSDGLVEATNSRGEEYGEGKLRELLAKVSEKSAGDIRGDILASLGSFSSTAELKDDLTLVVVRFKSTDG
jgi:sigma-B regulation protein RsbU (phosphoserine phosphatase)